MLLIHLHFDADASEVKGLTVTETQASGRGKHNELLQGD